MNIGGSRQSLKYLTRSQLADHAKQDHTRAPGFGAVRVGSARRDPGQSSPALFARAEQRPSAAPSDSARRPFAVRFAPSTPSPPRSPRAPHPAASRVLGLTRAPFAPSVLGRDAGDG